MPRGLMLDPQPQLPSPVLRYSRSRVGLADPGVGLLEDSSTPDGGNMKLNGSPSPHHAPIGAAIAMSVTKGVNRLQVLALATWIILCFKISLDSVLRMDEKLRNNFLHEAFLFYNPLFMVAMMVCLWGVNVWGFSFSRINYAKVFDLDQTHLTQREIWKVGSWMAIIILTSMTAYLYLCSHGDASLAAAQPIILYCGFLILVALPFNALYSSSRFFFLNTLRRLTLPLQPISFADFFLADVLTSMSKVLSDIERSVCRMYNHQFAPIDGICGNHSAWIPFVLAFPYLCRFFQCLRQYSDTKDKSCLFNALKYMTSFPVILLSALKYHVVLQMWEAVFRPLWLICSVINSFYSFYWDISRDWDLSCFPGSKLKHTLLRSNLLYNPRWVYYWAIGSNLILRCAWTYKLSAHLRHNHVTVFIFSGLEMLRRFQWVFFRVENEYNRILNRSTMQIDMKELSKESEGLLTAANYDA